MSTTEDKMDVAESEDSGVGTGSDAMSTRSAASTATLVSCPPPAFDGGVDYFDSGLLSPTSVTSSTQWSNSGHQHHVTGHIPSGHANAAHSNASSNRGLVMDDLDSTQKTQEWVEKHQDANVEMVDVSSDSGISEVMSVASISRASSLRASRPPAVDGNLDTFDSGLLSPTSVTSSTKWSNRGHQHHVTGHIRSDDPSHHGYPHAARSIASSDSGFVSGSERPGTKVSNQRQMPSVQTQQAVNGQVMNGTRESNDNVVCTTSDVMSAQKTPSASPFVDPNQSQPSTERLVIDIPQGGQSSESVVIGNIQVSEIKSTQSEKALSRQSSVSSVTGNSHISEIKSTQSEKAPSRQSSVSSVTGNSHISEIKSTQSEKAPSRQSSVSSVTGNSHISEIKSPQSEKAPSRQSSVSSVTGNSHISEIKSTQSEKAPSRQSSVSSVTGNSHLSEIKSTHAEKASSRQSSVSSVIGNSHISEIKSTQAHINTLVDIKASTPSRTNRTTQPAPKLIEKMDRNSFEVKVKDLKNHTEVIHARPDEKVSEFRKKVSTLTGNNSTSITTQYGATLEDNKRLSDYNIKHLDTVLSCDRMIGG
ncbi:uncharacterized protein LOC131934907 [Physella acuta]|uniref:uncharacterized protein LOC131934907 n=1 Tax=Physella acuta TaxID=109671 RepID=UPI0027DD51CC|nr:uncharacterized protein LOC131934907 [Physella acuta]